MALTANTLPIGGAIPTLPMDVNLQFASAQTITATGYLSNVNQQLTIGGGRKSFLCAVDLTAQSGTSPSFNFVVEGSNDSAWGNGNVENLCAFDYAPNTAQRTVPTIMGASPAIPDAGRAGSLMAKPFWNLGIGQIIYSYLRLYVVIAGTTPSITCTAWVVPFELRL